MSLLASRAAALPGCSYSQAPAMSSRRLTVRRPRLSLVHAQQGGGSSPPPSQQQQDDERRLEALEAAARARKGVKADQAEAFRGSRPASASSSSGGMPDWKEGQLFPEGWEEMDPLQKATQLYMGKRGFLFWATKSALWSVGILFGSWIVFRFIGPALGLYRLTNDLSTPNLF